MKTIVSMVFVKRNCELDAGNSFGMDARVHLVICWQGWGNGSLCA